jgi:hypothetical protein
MNSQLDNAGAASATHAFNLGCSATLLPGGLIVGGLFFLTGGNWIVGAVALVLALMVSLSLANGAALIARKRTLDRAFKELLKPEIEALLPEMGVTWSEFCQAARAGLPGTAVLKNYLSETPNQVDPAPTPVETEKETP